MSTADNGREPMFTSEMLASLLEPDEVVAREALDGDDLRDEALAAFSASLMEIDKLILLRAIDSRIIADMFWQELEEKISNGEKVSIGNRVRVNKGALEISYFKNIFQKRGGEGRRRYYADHIKRSGKYQYLSKDFRFAAPWESDLALGFEDHHAVNRKIFKHLSEARRNMRLALKEAEKAWGGVD